MADVEWNESPSAWTAVHNGEPVCMLKLKDIGGCTANWLNKMLWAPPSHMPKAIPQPTRFFPDVDEAKLAVEQQLQQAVG